MLVSWPFSPKIPVFLIIHMICTPPTLSSLVIHLLPLHLYLHYSLLLNVLLVMGLEREKDWIWPGLGEWDSGKEEWRAQEMKRELWDGRIVWVIRKSSRGGEGWETAWTLRCRTGTCDTEGPGGQYVPWYNNRRHSEKEMTPFDRWGPISQVSEER